MTIIRHLLITTALLVLTGVVHAHHVLGRPSYSLNEDSNTPPSMQVETQIGEYFVTYMVFPAFPKANEPGRVNLYASRINDGAPYQGEVRFSVRDDNWFSSRQEPLGSQVVDDNVFRQGFRFSEDGDYIITAEFAAGGEPYIIDFPLRIGEPLPIGPLAIAALVIIVVLSAVSLAQRKRLVLAKIRGDREARQQ